MKALFAISVSTGNFLEEVFSMLVDGLNDMEFIREAIIAIVL